MTDEEIFGRQLRGRLQAIGLSGKELAERVGASQPMVSKWTTGKAVPSWKVLQRVCHVLQCRVGYLFSEQTTEAEPPFRPTAGTDALALPQELRTMQQAIRRAPSLLQERFFAQYALRGKQERTAKADFMRSCEKLAQEAAAAVEALADNVGYFLR